MEKICKGNLANGNPCTFQSSNNSLFCKKHQPKPTYVSIGCDSVHGSYCNVSTNTDEAMYEIELGKETILNLLDEVCEKQKQIEAYEELLLHIYNVSKHT